MAFDPNTATLIAVDWGTSRLRTRLLDDAGSVLDTAESDEGIGRLEGNHEAVFERLTAKWPKVPAIMAGMVGSRQGWREAPYVPCPARTDQLGARTIQFTGAGGRRLAIVPGLMLATPERDFDVIRGEETQIAGLIAGEPMFSGLVILPGTHSKWARIENGTIELFQTFVSGELFELLAKKSFLRHSVAEGGADLAGTRDFTLGVERTAKANLPFLSALFSVRARDLLGAVDRRDNLAYLSGLVVGGEIAAARTTTPIASDTAIRLVASGPLGRIYRSAFAVLGVPTTECDGDNLVLDGLRHLAREIGFLPAVRP